MIYHHRTRSRRARSGRQRLPGGHLQRDLSGHHPGRRRAAQAVPAVLVSRRHSEPRRAGDARVDPRGRRARLRARRMPTARLSTIRTSSSPAVVGDGEAETGPLATSWHSNKFLNPGQRRRRAADPPSQRLQDRQPHRAGAHSAGRTAQPDARLRLRAVFRRSRRATTRAMCTRRWPRPLLDRCLDEIARHPARSPRPAQRRDGRSWPMIVLRTPKGWTGPEDSRRQADRGHLARPPGPARRAPETTPSTCSCSRTGCAATAPEELFDDDGTLRPEIAALAPAGSAADERQPARQRRPAAARSAAA